MFHITQNTLTSSLSSRLQAIPLFKAYRLGTSILGMIRTAMGHHYKFEFVLWPELEPRSPVCKASMLTTTPTTYVSHYSNIGVSQPNEKPDDQLHTSNLSACCTIWNACSSLSSTVTSLCLWNMISVRKMYFMPLLKYEKYKCSSTVSIAAATGIELRIQTNYTLSYLRKALLHCACLSVLSLY